MLQYDWLWSGHMIIKEMFHIPMKFKPELARAFSYYLNVLLIRCHPSYSNTFSMQKGWLYNRVLLYLIFWVRKAPTNIINRSLKAWSWVGVCIGGWVMVFNTTFNNISVISWLSVLLVEETGVPEENHRPAECHW